MPNPGLIRRGESPKNKLPGVLGEALGMGLGEFTGQYLANKSLDEVLNDPSLKDAPMSERASKLESAMRGYGKRGESILQKRLQIEQQAEQEKVQAALAKYAKGIELTPQEEALIPVAYRQKEMELKNRPPEGGTTSQPVPPFVTEAIEKVINENPNASPSELGVAFAKANIPPIYTNSYIENKRREAEAAIKAQSEDRAYHTKYSDEARKEADALRTSIPKKQMALRYARDAIESRDLSYFSPDKIADATGVDLFRTAKGAQLVTAAKENLLSNMGRVSAKGQNIWFEQRLNSMFPKVGQSLEANLTVAEMLEGEEAMDDAYLKEFDRLVKEDKDKYGFVRDDIKQRAVDAAAPLQKEILKHSSYRMKEIEERELGASALRKKVGAKVTPGTPLTRTMAKFYKEKYGSDDLTLKKLKEDGYYIPTMAEFEKYQQSVLPRLFE